VSRAARTFSPDSALVCPIRLTMTPSASNGRFRQFRVIWQNIRCSILIHLLVPGGRWQTLILSPVSSANLWRATHNYPKVIKVSDEQMSHLNFRPDAFHGEWNYTISAHQLNVV
jgi:hypothetical protein